MGENVRDRPFPPMFIVGNRQFFG